MLGVRIKIIDLYKMLKSIYRLFRSCICNTGFVSVRFFGYRKCNKLIVDTNNCLLKNCLFQIEGKNNVIEIADGCLLTGVWFLMVGDNNHIILHNNVYVNSDKRRMTMLNCSHGTALRIGEKTLFANDIEVQTTDHHKVIADGKQVNEAKSITIGKHCWIGAHSRLLKGSVIPQDSVVAACSVVTKDMKAESNVVIAGMPAKVVKRNVNWDY